MAFLRDKGQQCGVGVSRVQCKPNAAQLDTIRELVKAGKVQLYVAKVLPLAEIRQALDLSEGGRTHRKIAMQIAG